MRHECPATACTAEIPYEMLMCRKHWYMVPKAIRSAVWNAWVNEGAGTPQHTAAIHAAIRSVNEKLAAKGITGSLGGAA